MLCISRKKLKIKIGMFFFDFMRGLRGREKFPKEFLEWQVLSRYENIKYFKENKGMPYSGVHTPIMATLISKVNLYRSNFDINLAAKGVGLLPKRKYFREYNQKLQKIILRKDNLDERLNFLLDLYSDASKIDDTCLTTLEIYGTQTLHNLKAKPECSLLFVDMSYGIKSYQVNCNVKIYGPRTDFYKFVNGLHTLFHHQIEPPYAYKLKVRGVINKAPNAKTEDRKLV